MAKALWVLFVSLLIAVLAVLAAPEPTIERVEGRVSRYNELHGEGGRGTFLEEATVFMVVELNEWRMKYTALSQPVLDSLVYACGWPLLMGLLTMLAFPGREGWHYPAAGIACLLVVGHFGFDLFADGMFWFCVDVVVAVANLTGVSYNTANGFFFVVAFPLYTAFMVAAALIRLYTWLRSPRNLHLEKTGARSVSCGPRERLDRGGRLS